MDTHNQTISPEVQQAIESCPGLVGDEWVQVCGQIPVDVEGLAQETHVLRRRRAVKSALDLLRLVLAYAVCDWSLRLIGAWATVIGLAALSDVAVRKRLCQTAGWLGRIIGAWLQQRNGQLKPQAVRIRVIDASVISQPGSQGTDWRLHADLDLGGLSLTGIEVTDARGGETLERHTPEQGIIYLVDRGYAHRTGLGKFLAAEAFVVVRTNGQNLPLETAAGQKFDLLAWLPAHTSPEPGELPLWVTTPGARFPVRLIAQPLPLAAAEQARRRLYKNSRKKGHTPTQLSLAAAGFVLIVTNLPAKLWPADQVAALYRLRWQIELLFKRLKSILNLDHLRAKNPRLAQVYLLGKLIGVLLIEDWTHDWTHSDLAEWFDDTRCPVSLWRWMCAWGDLLRNAIRGPLTLARWIAALPRLGRYLRDSPRKRPQQAAGARRWLNALGLPVDTLKTVEDHVPALDS